MCCDWLGLGGRGHMTHRPDEPSQALEGCGSLFRKVTRQTTSCWQKRRATLGLLCGGKKGGSGESELSDLFRCKQFCSAFSFEFSFVILAKFCHYWHNHYYFLFIQNKISIYTILSLFFFFNRLCTEVQRSPPLSPVASRFPRPALAVGRRQRQRLQNQETKQTKQTKVIKYAALFSNMAQFPGRVQISKQYFLFEMDTVENNIFTLNI